MARIRQALAQVKEDLPRHLESHVYGYLAEHPEHVWRCRQLDPLTLVLMFMTQVLHGNTAITHLRHLAGMSCSATAYCKARMRLPRALLEYVSTQVTNELARDAERACRWLGHRMWRADGTSFSMPDTAELQETFGQPGGQRKGCGFPSASLLVLCDAAGFIVKTLAMPLRTHDASQIARVYDAMAPDDVLVYDRAACSYSHLALLLQRDLHAIFRMHQRQIVSFRPGRKHAAQLPKGKRAGKPRSQWLRRLGPCDQLVRWFKPSQRPRWMTAEAYAALPDSLVLREHRYKVCRKGFRTRYVTIVSTLLDDEKYSAQSLAEQYLDRWQIEVDFRHLKQTMKMDVLRCKTTDGVLKELAMFVLVYNLVRQVMLRAAQRQNVPLDRISFIDALRWLWHALPGEEPVPLIVVPKREGRLEPRVVKRRPKPHRLMTKPREELRQALKSSRLAA
jgi:hypothetical protein